MRRPILVLAMIVTAALSLSGCSVLAPTRDADGTIITATRMPSIDAWVGDCFSFVEGSDLAFATVVPCAEPHTHIVIGTGTLSQKRIDHFESLQIAVLTACKDRVSLYAAQQGLDPAPEYIVSNKTRPNGSETMHYSCLVKAP